MNIMSVKKCTKCEESKPLAEFGNCKANKDGYKSQCRGCVSDYHALWNSRPGNKQRRSMTNKIRHSKPDIKLRHSLWWFSYINKSENKQRKKGTELKWREDNKERIKNNNKEYREANLHVMAAHAGKYRSAKLNASCVLTNQGLIKSIYAMSAFLTWATFGKGYHVDHIVPLQGVDVCGLHVANNLQILRAEHNLSKGNSHVSYHNTQ
jgi:hypothetical protein